MLFVVCGRSRRFFRYVTRDLLLEDPCFSAASFWALERKGFMGFCSQEGPAPAFVKPRTVASRNASAAELFELCGAILRKARLLLLSLAHEALYKGSFGHESLCGFKLLHCLTLRSLPPLSSSGAVSLSEDSASILAEALCEALCSSMYERLHRVSN